MPSVCATALVTIFACALPCTRAMYVWQNVKYAGPNCTGEVTEDMTMSVEAALMHSGESGSGECIAHEGSSMKTDVTSCSTAMYMNQDCSGPVMHNHTHVPTCSDNHDSDNPEEMSEKSGCVMTVPETSKDMTCLNAAHWKAINDTDCTITCPHPPNSCEELLEMSKGCARGCSALVLEAYKAWTVGCNKPCGDKAVRGDPVTTFNGKRMQFWLKVGQFVELIKVGSVLLLGMARDYASTGGQQWLTDFILKKNREEVLRVSAADPEPLIPKEANAFNDADDKASLKTLVITTKVAGQRQTVTRFGQLSVGSDDIRVDVKPLRSRIGVGHKEEVTVQTAEMSLRLVSAKANKFQTEEQRIRHLHVDMELPKVDYNKATGVLPEIWGIRPLSPETEAMLHEPMNIISI